MSEKPSWSAFKADSDPDSVSFSLYGTRYVMPTREALALAWSIIDEGNVQYVCARCSYPHGSMSEAGRAGACPGCGMRHYATGSGMTRGAARAKHAAWLAARDARETERTAAFRAVFA